MVCCRTRGHGRSALGGRTVARNLEGSTTPWHIRAPWRRPPSNALGVVTGSTALTIGVTAGYCAPGATWRRLRRGQPTRSWTRRMTPGIGLRPVDSRALETCCLGARAVRLPTGCNGYCRRAQSSMWGPAMERWLRPSCATAEKLSVWSRTHPDRTFATPKSKIWTVPGPPSSSGIRLSTSAGPPWL